MKSNVEYKQVYTMQDRSVMSEEHVDGEITDEQRQERRLDEKNVTVQLMVRGDAVNFPVSFSILAVSLIQLDLHDHVIL